MFASVHLVCHRAIAILVIFRHLPLLFVIRVFSFTASPVESKVVIEESGPVKHVIFQLG